MNKSENVIDENYNEINEEQIILEQKYLSGPRSRWKEFKFAFSVFLEFIKGFRKLHFVGPCITIFGSARFDSEHPYYQKTIEVAKGISKLGFTVMSGGGPGIMEAANKGAKLAKGKSVGCNIVLPFEQEPNPYVDYTVDIKYFFVRKVFLLKYSYGFVVMPGGFGTLDEIFEALTLIQTKKILDFPVVIIGVDYWKKMMELLDTMSKEKTISPEDIKMLFVTDSVEEAIKYLKIHALPHYKNVAKNRPKPLKWLGE